MPEYEFIYFPVRGKGENIRYIFAQAGVPYKENAIQMADWPNHKPKAPFGFLPILKVDGKTCISQSTAIGRYLANEFGLAGQNNLEKAMADQFVEGFLSDVYSVYQPVYMVLVQGGTPDQAKAKFAKFKEENLKSWLDRYEKFLTDNGTGYFVGSKLTWADLTVAEMLNRFTGCFDPTALSGHPHLAKHCAMVHNLPNIKKYCQGRPPMPF